MGFGSRSGPNTSELHGRIDRSEEHANLGPPTSRPPSFLHSPGIAASYFVCGFLPAFMGTPLTVYMVKEINAHPSVQNTVFIALSTPWSFKVRVANTCSADTGGGGVPGVMCGTRSRQ